MRANRVKEKQLQEDVSFNKIVSGLSFVTVKKIKIFHGNKLMKPKFDHISVYHLFICLFNLANLFFNLIFKNIVKVSNVFIL